MSDEGTEARLTALEFFVEGLWAQQLAKLPSAESQQIVESFRRAAGRWALTPGNPPRDVQEVEFDHAVAQAWIEILLERILERERLLRRHQPS
jgi:hypothetical protein